MAKIHIEKAELEKMLKIVGTCVVPSKILPISEHIRITTKGGRIKAEAANSGGGIKTYASLGMETEDMSFCVGYKDLSRYVSAVADDEITLDVDLKNNEVNVMHSGGGLAMPCVDAKDFPEMETPGEGCECVTLAGSLLADWLQRSKGFTVPDNLRPILGGAYIQLKDGILSISASDTKVLFYDAAGAASANGTFGADIPTSAFSAITTMAEKAETVTIHTDGKKAWFKTGSTTLMVLLIVGKYPNVQSIIPSTFNYEVKVSRERLLESLKRISLAIGAQSHIIKFVFSDIGTLSISHDNLGEMKTARESLAYDGALNFTVGFGHEAFMKAVSAMTSDNISFRMTDPTHAVVLKEADGPEEKTVLVMPMVVVNSNRSTTH